VYCVYVLMLAPPPHLAQVALHEVDLADAPELLLEDIDLKRVVTRSDKRFLPEIKAPAAAAVRACRSRCVAAEPRSWWSRWRVCRRRLRTSRKLFLDGERGTRGRAHGTLKMKMMKVKVTLTLLQRQRRAVRRLLFGRSDAAAAGKKLFKKNRGRRRRIRKELTEKLQRPEVWRHLETERKLQETPPVV